MGTRTSAASLALSLALAGTSALAQTTAGDPGPSTTATPHPAPAPARSATAAATGPRLFGRNEEHSVGARFWMWITPSWLPGAFAHVEGDWGGSLTVSPGVEYVYRKGSLDLVIGAQYLGLGTGVGYLRGNNESDIALERIQSSLWFANVSGTFLWTVRINEWAEFQGGVGLMLGYTGGDLNRTQAYRDGAGGAVRECGTGTLAGGAPQPVPAPGGRPAVPYANGYCGTDNNHYLYNDGTRYSERSIFDGGAIPRVLLLPTLPHLAFHFRPHRNFDIRVDGGFALAGFFGGLAMHYVF